MPGAVGKPCSSVAVMAVHKALLFTLTSVLFQSDPEMSRAHSVPLEPVPCFHAAVSPGFRSQLVQSVFFQVLQCLGSLAFWLSAPLVPCQPLCCTWHACGLSPVTRMWGNGIHLSGSLQIHTSFSFLIPREHPSGDTDALCSEAGPAEADVVSAPAARRKRSSQHPQPRRRDARELGLGEGLPEVASASDRVRMTSWFLCLFFLYRASLYFIPEECLTGEYWLEVDGWTR